MRIVEVFSAAMAMHVIVRIARKIRRRKRPYRISRDVTETAIEMVGPPQERVGRNAIWDCRSLLMAQILC